VDEYRGQVHLQRIDQEELSDDDGEPLEVNRLPTVVAEVVDAKHGRVSQLRDLGHNPFEVGEERRIV